MLFMFFLPKVFSPWYYFTKEAILAFWLCRDVKNSLMIYKQIYMSKFFYVDNLLKGPVGWEAGLLPINTIPCVIRQTPCYLYHINQYLWPQYVQILDCTVVAQSTWDTQYNLSLNTSCCTIHYPLNSQYKYTHTPANKCQCSFIITIKHF